MIHKSKNALVVGTQVVDCQEDGTGLALGVLGLKLALHEHLQQPAPGCLDGVLLNIDWKYVE